MKKFSEFVSETTVTAVVAGVKDGDEPPVKKKPIMVRRKPVDIK